MYSDIIPPRKNNSIRNINPERFDESDPVAPVYQSKLHPKHDRSFPKFFLFLILLLEIHLDKVYFPICVLPL